MYTITLQTNSKRGKAWVLFAEMVLSHIDKTIVPNYTIDGEEAPTEEASINALVCARNCIRRINKNSRDGEQTRDFLKIAHYAQIAYNQWRGK